MRRRAAAGDSAQRVALRVACGVSFSLVATAATLDGDQPTVVMYGWMEMEEAAEQPQAGSKGEGCCVAPRG